MRAAQAGQTRLAILAAATRLFAEQGWAGTGMRDVARAAQVSVETVYANFGSKAQLLKQAMDVAVVGDDEPVPLSDRPEFRALAEGDARARAEATGRLMVSLRRRSARLQRVLQQAGPSDPELAGVLQAGRVTERQDFRKGLTAVAQRDVTETEVDEMFAVLSNDVYLLLTETCGWTDDAYQSWVATTVVRLLNLQGE
ncbi:MAG TPA: helix-turn-helix domain-containing protein [Streptosporangiaceae bacterium]|nr:helix-turn-helix domain-containing protein [Streptosporangiaceae bacterium]